MKDDEKEFFLIIYKFCRHDSVIRRRDGALFTPREIINVIEPWMHHKRCWYLLKKWSGLGFYDYGVTLDLGWIEKNNLPERYKILVEE